MSQLLELVKPFPPKFVHTNPSGGGSYVKHAVIQQRMMQVLGGFSFERVEIIRGDVDALPPNPNGKSEKARAGSPRLQDVIVGVIARLRATVDDEPRTEEEAGDCESPHNWPHDGARLKDAMSDAFKRCALRLGLGIHLWAGDDFYLFDALTKREDSDAKPIPSEGEAVSDDAEPISAVGSAVS